MNPDTALTGEGETDGAAGTGTRGLLDALTDKQREVLDLLIQHKTSKEISRDLGISPHTVDQRIMLARAKLNVSSRGEVAQEYRRLLAQVGARGGEESVDTSSPARHEVVSPTLYGQPVYRFSNLAPVPPIGHQSERDDMAIGRPAAVRGTGHTSNGVSGDRALAEPYYHVLPEMFDGPYGTLMRLGAIALITMVLILIVLGGLTMFTQLSRIIDW